MAIAAFVRTIVVGAICSAWVIAPPAPPDATGAVPSRPRWLERFTRPDTPMGGVDVALDASGRRVYAAISNLDGGPSTVVAYSTRTGAELWRWSNRTMVVSDIR